MGLTDDDFTADETTEDLDADFMMKHKAIWRAIKLRSIWRADYKLQC